LFSPTVKEAKPLAIAQASVKEDGAAFRRGGKRRRHDDIEVEEAGALDDAGSGSSPRAAPVFAVNGVPSDSLQFLPPPLHLLPPFFLLRRRCGQGRILPRGG
jgi:hypothetical protein